MSPCVFGFADVSFGSRRSCLFSWSVRAGSPRPDLRNGILYETFGSNGASAINLTDPPTGLGNLFMNATNIVAGGGKVYFESGDTIYSTTPDLVGLTAVFTNGQAPTGLALDASSGILYETFGSNGISAIDLADPQRSLGNLFINATNIVAGGGKVYFESGDTIYSTTPDLVGLTAVITNGQAPTGLARGRLQWDPLRDVWLEWDLRDRSGRSAKESGEPVH